MKIKHHTKVTKVQHYNNVIKIRIHQGRLMLWVPYESWQSKLLSCKIYRYEVWMIAAEGPYWLGQLSGQLPHMMEVKFLARLARWGIESKWDGVAHDRRPVPATTPTEQAGAMENGSKVVQNDNQHYKEYTYPLFFLCFLDLSFFFSDQLFSQIYQSSFLFLFHCHP